MQPVSFRVVRKSGTSVNTIGTGTDITLQVGDDKGSDATDTDRVKVRVQRIKLKNVAGATIAMFQPALFSASGAALGDIEQEYNGFNTVKADLYDDNDLNLYMLTDTRGRLFLRPTPDAGADNQFKYSVTYEVHF